MRKAALLILVPLLVGCRAHAQTAASDSARVRETCRFAEQILTTGRPAAKLGWAASVIGACDADLAARAVIGGVRISRSLTDTVTLRHLWRATDYFRDAGLLRSILEIAGDARASVPSRVFAFRALALIEHPERNIEYRQMVGGIDRSLPIAVPKGGCGFGSFASHVSLTTGEPLPSDYQELISEVQRRVFMDQDEPLDVRSAALCV